jgi:hypothetical protein
MVMRAAIALLVGLVILYVVLKLALGLIGIATAIALAVLAYLIAEKVMVQGR